MKTGYSFSKILPGRLLGAWSQRGKKLFLTRMNKKSYTTLFYAIYITA
jgi:hypothetical protein